ncbi:MAG: hypothetical protein Roseis2KO_51150 [Roseivirga sp.]
MNSPKVKTQKTLSAVLAAALAIVTLFQAGTANSNEVSKDFISFEEAQLVAEIEEMLMEEEEMAIEEEIYFEEMEELTEKVRVYDNNNELIGEGDPLVNPVLGMLVNKADLLSQMGGHTYYRVSQ